MRQGHNSTVNGLSFESGYISIDSYHDLQDILIRIDMPQASFQFHKLWVKVNPFVDCSSPRFLAEVWGLERQPNYKQPQCLYLAPGRL